MDTVTVEIPGTSNSSANTSAIDRCLWTDAALLLPRRPDAPLPTRTDVAIIGGGYTGLAAARALARRGADATVLEQHTLGWGASGRNGGFVLPGYKPEMEELAQRLGAARAARMFQLSLEAIRHLSSLISEEAFESLDAPVRRLTAPDVPIPFSPPLERAVLPQVDDVKEACRELLAY